MSKLDLEIAEAEAKLRDLQHKKDKVLSRTNVVCTGNLRGNGCGAKTQIGQLTYIQTLWYEKPWGCTGGDTWHNGEGRFDCQKCGLRNRLYDRHEIEALKYHFKDIREEHDRD